MGRPNCWPSSFRKVVADSRSDASPRARQAEALRSFFAIQLAFAKRMAVLRDEPLREALFRYTSLHRKFGFGVPGPVPEDPRWTEFVDQLAAVEDSDSQLERIVSWYGLTEEEAAPDPATLFGCFNFTGPDETGAARSHFVNREHDPLTGPLARTKLPIRLGELRALIPALLGAHSNTTHILGRSWLYHREAYRRLYPPAYTSQTEPLPKPVSLVGGSSWGQYLTHSGANESACNQFLDKLPQLQAHDPLGIFGYRPIQVRAPIAEFVGFYR
jgi:hypothetical protein